MLSVVLPVYDVEAWLPACLDSIAAQSFEDYELIVVDDGSPDRSAALVERAMRSDPRIRMLRQDNAGLGAARNTGVRAAQGELLAFADSDDVVPPGAWQLMVETVRRTGSDFVVGRGDRDDGTRRWPQPLMRRNHEARQLAIDVRRAPLLLADVFAWNKVFRRDFWVRHGLWFPEGVRYEDQPAITRAFLAARAFDVLTETVYLWRVRDDGSSITQLRHQLADLRDRLATKRESLTAVRAYADDEVTRVFLAEVLPVDLWEYFRAVPGSDEDYWRTLVEGVRELWNAETLPFEETRVPPQQRLMGWFVVADRRPDLERLLAWIDDHRPLPFDGDELDHPWRGEPGLPRLRH